MDTFVVGTRVSNTHFFAACDQIMTWAREGHSRYVCVANVHMLMEAYDSSGFAKVVNGADLVIPDGMPLVWLMRLKGQRDQQRVYGPTLMLHVLEAAARARIPVGFYGGMPEVLDLLVKRMQARYEGLIVAYSFSPPFRSLSPQEDEKIVEAINQSGARILFVGLGCPKQEIWMAEHRGRVNAVMLGVGAAFDFHAGVKPQAPAWMQAIGLEWFFRLMIEPRRLWKRYLIHNPRFLVLAMADLLGLLKG
ncbi:MAG TPA: WecB/TagA/CpsF family glycosyltransferase [Anaerolineales bacterium]|nr:WecB/TagA/CpsF family glycosyltransferase [Anaerolineales bacterium]